MSITIRRPPCQSKSSERRFPPPWRPAKSGVTYLPGAATGRCRQSRKASARLFPLPAYSKPEMRGQTGPQTGQSAALEWLLPPILRLGAARSGRRHGLCSKVRCGKMRAGKTAITTSSRLTLPPTIIRPFRNVFPSPFLPMNAHVPIPAHTNSSTPTPYQQKLHSITETSVRSKKTANTPIRKELLAFSRFDFVIIQLATKAASINKAPTMTLVASAVSFCRNL